MVFDSLCRHFHLPSLGFLSAIRVEEWESGFLGLPFISVTYFEEWVSIRVDTVYNTPQAVKIHGHPSPFPLFWDSSFYVRTAHQLQLLLDAGVSRHVPCKDFQFTLWDRWRQLGFQITQPGWLGHQDETAKPLCSFSTGSYCLKLCPISLVTSEVI